MLVMAKMHLSLLVHSTHTKSDSYLQYRQMTVFYPFLADNRSCSSWYGLKVYKEKVFGASLWEWP